MQVYSDAKIIMLIETYKKIEKINNIILGNVLNCIVKGVKGPFHSFH